MLGLGLGLANDSLDRVHLKFNRELGLGFRASVECNYVHRGVHKFKIRL